MPVETPTLFSKVIQEHLELKQRNAALEPEMPLTRYKTDDPFDNHPLFKTEEQARIEDTMNGEEISPVAVDETLGWLADEDAPEEEKPAEQADGLWSRSRDFDWGD